MTDSPLSPALLDPKNDPSSQIPICGGDFVGMTGATSDLLHNMSAPPQSAIIHHDRRSRCGGPGLIVRGELLPEPTTLRSILALFTGDEVPEADVERRLRREILAYAAGCGLPAVALVTRQASECDTLCADPRTVACLLTQASSRVYLRDKEPNLSYLRRDREFILVVDLRELSS